MTSIQRLTLTVAAVLGFAVSACAQGMMRPPHVPGEFKPVVGAGAQYQMSTKDGKTQTFAMAVVGKEDVDGQDGYWLEWRIDTGQGKMVMKQLMAGGQVKRMIMQPPGQPPMEMPAGMLSMAARHGQPDSSDAGPGHAKGELLGTESVTVPAGTFESQHLRSTVNGKNADVWATGQVSPYGLVKMVTSDGTTMVLQKVLDHEVSQIQGEPRKMNMPGMPQ